MTIPMYDLFISYSSHDRPWAERAYNDLRRSFRSINVFWDRVAIPAGGDWRTFLTGATVNTKHLLVFWSNAAHQSVEVSPEIATFEAEVRLNPTSGARQRKEFFIALEGTPGGVLSSRQGFPDLAPFYRPNLPDCGASAIDSDPTARREWNRAIRMIGDAVVEAETARPMLAAVIAQKDAHLTLLDSIHHMNLSTDESKKGSLDEFLGRYQLTWADVRTRYGASALDWRPYGEKDTIVDLLEDLRIETNNHLSSTYWFRWEYLDLADQGALEHFCSRQGEPSIVVVDPISLFHIVYANAFRKLEKYLREEQSVMVSLAPVRQEGADWFADAMKEQSVPVLNDYFEPSIPPVAGFAKCAINVPRISDIERLIRSRLGSFYLAQVKQEARDTTGMARK